MVRVIGNLEVEEGVILNPLAGDPAGVEGKIYYNDTSNTVRFYNGTSWSDL